MLVQKIQQRLILGISLLPFMACPQEIMDQETQYLAALQTAATFRIEGTRMELRTQDGALAVDFSKK